MSKDATLHPRMQAKTLMFARSPIEAISNLDKSTVKWPKSIVANITSAEGAQDQHHRISNLLLNRTFAKAVDCLNNPLLMILPRQAKNPEEFKKMR